MHLGLPTQAVAVFLLTVVLLILASDSDWDWFEVGDSVFVSELRLADLSANGGLGGMLPGRVHLRGAVGCPGAVFVRRHFHDPAPRGDGTVGRVSRTVPHEVSRPPRCECDLRPDESRVRGRPTLRLVP